MNEICFVVLETNPRLKTSLWRHWLIWSDIVYVWTVFLLRSTNSTSLAIARHYRKADFHALEAWNAQVSTSGSHLFWQFHINLLNYLKVESLHCNSGGNFALVAVCISLEAFLRFQVKISVLQGISARKHRKFKNPSFLGSNTAQKSGIEKKFLYFRGT